MPLHVSSTVCSKHVEVIVKQKFFASSWLITKINIKSFYVVAPRCCSTPEFGILGNLDIIKMGRWYKNDTTL